MVGANQPRAPENRSLERCVGSGTVRFYSIVSEASDAKRRGRCFWEQESITFAECVAYRTKDEPDERKARVQASFNSTIKKISQRVLGPLTARRSTNFVGLTSEQVGEQAMQIYRARDGHTVIIRNHR